MTKTILLLVMLAIVTSAVAQPGDHRIEQKSVAGLQLSIYLPPGYDTMQTKCPVLYFNDGQTIFSDAGLDMEAIADTMIRNGHTERMIIVGIHSDQNRTSNYVPYEDAGAKADFGEYEPKAKAYTEKIIRKLIPFIEKNYRVNDKRGIGGYSFGGLHAVWAALNYPETFQFSAGMSPSFWVNEFKIYDEASKAKDNQLYYFDMGTAEWNYYVPFIPASRLDLLRNVFYYEVQDAAHIIPDWRKRVPNILLLFAGKQNATSYTWEIQQEVIKSSVTRKFYLRINPVIHYNNGLTCSISLAAKFTLLNPEDGVVNTDGSFRFTGTKDLKVTIEYKGEVKQLTLSYNEIEQIKAGL